MNTLEVLTLMLVVFAALSYIDDHNKKKIASHSSKVDAILYICLHFTEGKSELHPITFLIRLYIRAFDFSSALFKLSYNFFYPYKNFFISTPLPF